MKKIILILTTCFVWQSFCSATEALFHRWDRNSDGVLVIDEVPLSLRKFFPSKDADGDGKVTLQEHLGSAKHNSKPKPQDAGEPNPALRIRQDWHQEPDGFDREVFVRTPEKAGGKVPVVIYFHGNGGLASKSVRRFSYLKDVLFLAPQGYERSWNIFGERSEAPDVEFLKQLLRRIPLNFPQADMQNLVLIGSSNGAGIINRIMIEMDEHPYRLVIQLVASLIEEQYHDGSFWASSKSTNRYDILRKPVTPGPEVLYFHGTEDKVVPYAGGLRSRKYPHVSAQDTAYAWAKAFGHEGPKIPDTKGREVAKGLILYAYPDASVRHYKLTGSGHNIRPYERLVEELIRKAVLRK